ncbi:MAG: hypothetical protein J6S32_00860, partial [Clostridia bacterium]|nr:hypothetical protein [Clostridia bacterium]
GERIPCNFLVNPSECALGLLRDGRVLISIRNENECRYRCFAVSANGYEGWEQVALDDYSNIQIYVSDKKAQFIEDKNNFYNKLLEKMNKWGVTK